MLARSLIVAGDSLFDRVNSATNAVKDLRRYDELREHGFASSLTAFFAPADNVVRLASPADTYHSASRISLYPLLPICSLESSEVARAKSNKE